jgi:cysteinyl-tRNA synthetase
MDDRLLLIKGLERSLIDQKIVERTEAREAKNYQRSDEIRDELLAMGIDLQDSREGTYWEVRKGDI